MNTNFSKKSLTVVAKPAKAVFMLGWTAPDGIVCARL